MARSFNTAGPCHPQQHYMLPPERRLGRVMEIIDAEKYFTLTGGWQIGKTTSARWLVDHYNGGERYRCTWVDIQSAREVADPAEAFAVVLENFEMATSRDLPGVRLPDRGALLATPRTAVLNCLRQLSAGIGRPLVVLIDEADGLIGEAMVSFLTQIRQGYIDRTRTPFPHSVCLIGRRQVRDYVLSQTERRAVSWLGTASPFNITAEAAVLSAAFAPEEVAELLGQHTADTGQPFLPEAAGRVHELSCGHPWLVNALADQITDRDARDRSVAVTAAHVESAKDTLILERRTHIDSLVARLREPRVRRIIEPMLIGERVRDGDTISDDFAYVLGLGLLALRGGEYVIANPIYKEVIPRVLTFDQQAQLHLRPASYLRPDGRLDMPRLMAAWQKFWRQDGHLAAEGFAYREAGPHLMLMAYLQRIVNGGGKIDREYALGRGAVDLMIHFAGERHAVELKLRRDTVTGAEALEQLLGYLDAAGLPEGWLVMFDAPPARSEPVGAPLQDVPWEEKLTLEEVLAEGKRIWVVGC